MNGEQGELTDFDRAQLALERGRWAHPGAKDARIREELDVSPTVYHARLDRLIDTPAALSAEPVLVRRLQRLRASRRAQRSTRRASA